MISVGNQRTHINVVKTYVNNSCSNFFLYYRNNRLNITYFFLFVHCFNLTLKMCKLPTEKQVTVGASKGGKYVFIKKEIL